MEHIISEWTIVSITDSIPHDYIQQCYKNIKNDTFISLCHNFVITQNFGVSSDFRIKCNAHGLFYYTYAFLICPFSCDLLLLLVSSPNERDMNECESSKTWKI